MQKDLNLSPGWYLARNNTSSWWNLFVHITERPPFKCYVSTAKGTVHTEIFPEEIKEVSSRRISLPEFEVLQQLGQEI